MKHKRRGPNGQESSILELDKEGGIWFLKSTNYFLCIGQLRGQAHSYNFEINLDVRDYDFLTG